ncbi:MAG: hypothetical protein K0U68_12905, partial [Gammaproteobacteria bacterium]|nr:hypothetical protein [Gammaproteobacteria bacterium]
MLDAIARIAVSYRFEPPLPIRFRALLCSVTQERHKLHSHAGASEREQRLREGARIHSNQLGTLNSTLI